MADNYFTSGGKKSDGAADEDEAQPAQTQTKVHFSSLSNPNPNSMSLGRGSRRSTDYGLTKQQIVIPVVWGSLGWHTFKWYSNHIHQPFNYVHVIHIPDLWSRITPGMDAVSVMEVMKEINIVAAELKSVYIDLMKEYQVDGKFMKVSGNSCWSAIVEYSKKVNATMIIMGSESLAPAPNTTDDRNTPHPATRSMISSVTQDVLFHSRLPVVVVRLPETVKRLSLAEKAELWKPGELFVNTEQII